MKINKKVKNIIGVLLSAIILYFIIVRFCKYWPEISPFLQNANWVYMLVGIIIVSIGIGIIAFIWQIVFKDLYKINLPFYQCLSIIFLPNIARYIPGKFWFIFGTVFLAKRWKLDVSATIVVSIIAQLFFLLGGIWVGFIASLLGKMEITTLILLPAVLFGILIFFLPSIFYKILNKVLGVGEPGARLEIPGGGEGKPLEEIISCINKAGLNITSLHIYKRRGRAKKNIIIQVDSEDVAQCVSDLKNMGYEVKLRRANSG